MHIERMEWRLFSGLIQPHLAFQRIETGDIHIMDIAKHMNGYRPICLKTNRHLLRVEVHVQPTLRVFCTSPHSHIGTLR